MERLGQLHRRGHAVDNGYADRLGHLLAKAGHAATTQTDHLCAIFFDGQLGRLHDSGQRALAVLFQFQHG